MTAPRAAPMACLGCGYALDIEAPESRCPECGRPFDPEDEFTFSRVPVPGWWGRLLRHPATWVLGGAPIAVVLDFLVLRGRAPYAMWLLVSGAAMGWYVYDCKRRRRRPKTSYALAMFFFPPFLAVYAIVVHRARGAVIALAALATLAGSMIIARLTMALLSL